jgi:hypothetical protein
MSPTQKGGGWFGSSNSYNSHYTSPDEHSVPQGVLQYLYYLGLIIIIVLLVLVLVNYTITPIFRLNPGDKGLISLPGSDDSVLFWKTPNSIIQLQDTATPLGTMTQNWSFLLDVHLDDPTANTGAPRILFSRGEAPKSSAYSSKDTILTVNPNFNICVYLDPLINDLYVSTQILGPNAEIKIQTITLPNIPVGKGLRLGVFLGSRVLEVYTNGFLVSNKAFPNSVRAVVGPIHPPSSDIITSTAQVSNLRIWGRPVSPAEFRSYGAPPTSTFLTKIIPDTCLAK